MDTSTSPEASPINRIKTNHELIQGQKMPRLPETASFDPTSAQSIAVKASKMSGNTDSTMSTDSVNKVPHLSTNNTSSSNSSDCRRSIVTNKMVKRTRGCSIRKRPWTYTKVTSLIDDGHVWRKYGQKEIINTKHKRNYYRCTNKFDQGCQATKQVQQIEDVPPKYKVTYNQHHTCKNFLGTPQMILDSINLKDTSILLSFQSNGIIDKEQVGSDFPSYTHEESKEALSFLRFGDNQLSLVDFNSPQNLIMSDHLRPSVMSTRLELGDEISKEVYSPIFEMGLVLECINYSENPFDLAHCELNNFNHSFMV